MSKYHNQDLITLIAQIGPQFDIRVTPNAAQDKIVITDAGEIKVYVTSIADDGKANNAVIKLLAKSLGIAKGQISIERGHKSRSKTILINY